MEYNNLLAIFRQLVAAPSSLAVDLMTVICSLFCMKSAAESKLEGLDDQLRRCKTQLDEMTRQNQDLNNLKARLTQENFEFQRQVQELDAGNAALSKARSQLQAQLDETKARLDEETRVSDG